MRSLFLLILLAFPLLSISGQRKSRLPDSGVEIGGALTPLQLNYFRVPDYEPGSTNTLLFDPIPELYIRFPAGITRIRVTYDWFSATRELISGLNVNDTIGGEYSQHILSIGIEQPFRVKRYKLYWLGEIRFLHSSFDNTMPVVSIPGSVFIGSMDEVLYGIGIKVGIGLKRRVLDNLDLFAESSLSIDRLMDLTGFSLFEQTRLTPAFITIGLNYKFLRAFDCNCPTNTIRR